MQRRMSSSAQSSSLEAVHALRGYPVIRERNPKLLRKLLALGETTGAF